jgi:hypothetical protein
VQDPAVDFQNETGLEWPVGAKIVSADDSRGDGKSGDDVLALTIHHIRALCRG